MSFADELTMREKLREKFPPEQIGKLPRTSKRPELDYVGHAAVTDRLNRYAPDWTYTVDKLFNSGDDTWIEGTMTIGGVSRVEYGDGKTPKEAISDFVKRGAMRFGVALDLWSKEELQSESASGGQGRHAPTLPSDGEIPPDAPSSPAPLAGTKTEGQLRQAPAAGSNGEERLPVSTRPATTAPSVAGDTTSAAESETDNPPGHSTAAETSGEEGAATRDSGSSRAVSKRSSSSETSEGAPEVVGEGAEGAPSGILHQHGSWSTRKPDGGAMRSGWVRCTNLLPNGQVCNQGEMRRRVNASDMLPEEAA